jgi:hypothetical protein
MSNLPHWCWLLDCSGYDELRYSYLWVYKSAVLFLSPISLLYVIAIDLFNLLLFYIMHWIILIFILCIRQSITFTNDQMVLTKVGICELAANNTDTMIGLQNCNQQQYMSTVSIGIPPQNFTFLFDTGSVYMWVPFTGCVGNCSTHQFNYS